ncbi:hypothetical protein TRICI_001679 [Trichomonascus ciferrii]|uniref:Hydrophobin n=1 Tax=Trichomonascus ciferrii TaxID=44093 RepID=A0A642V8M6_9ASCO|nr:hypothetical protein TRICI_001679 [Trichomonascus ciferrii]
MKFGTALLSAVAATAAVAAPNKATQNFARPQGEMKKFAGNAHGTIECNPDTKICTVKCGESLQAICTLVGAFDSVFYGLETLVGFTIHCTEKGCNVYCPVDGTVTCALNEAGAAFDSVFAIGEMIIVDGLANLLSGTSPDEAAADDSNSQDQ